MSNHNKQNKENNVFFITGGGTGGHIYPALAVIEKLIDLNKKVYYIGNKNNLEYKIMKEVKNLTFLNVNIKGMPRKINFSLFKWFFYLFFAIIRSIGYIIKYKPDVLFGTGGYISAPALIGAIITRKPFIMHDCDAVPGLVSRYLSNFAKKMSVVFETQKKYLNCKNIIINGNPLRESFFNCDIKKAYKNLNLDPSLKTLTVMGGSQGARFINSAILPIIKELVNLNIQIIIITGKKNFDEFIDEIKNIYPEYNQNKNLKIIPYCENMPDLLTITNLVISRSGSLSLSEICATKTASILIPYPFAANNHQFFNAKYFMENQAGILLEEKDINSEILKEKIVHLLSNDKILSNICEASYKLSKPNALNDIVLQLINLK